MTDEHMGLGICNDLPRVTQLVSGNTWIPHMPSTEDDAGPSHRGHACLGEDSPSSSPHLLTSDPSLEFPSGNPHSLDLSPCGGLSSRSDM